MGQCPALTLPAFLLMLFALSPRHAWCCCLQKMPASLFRQGAEQDELLLFPLNRHSGSGSARCSQT